MNEHENFRLEAELSQLRPAKLPENLVERLAAGRPNVSMQISEHPSRAPQASDWGRLLRWLVPATAAVACLVVLVLLVSAPKTRKPELAAGIPAPSGLEADTVEIDRRLIAAFDAVATLPSGEPVRVLCREWMDEVVLRDTARGVSIEQRAPRFEVVPVSFETF
jgi:hypothetical protein